MWKRALRSVFRFRMLLASLRTQASRSVSFLAGCQTPPLRMGRGRDRRPYCGDPGSWASTGEDTNFDYATVAFDADNGDEIWVARYAEPGDVQDSAEALGLSPDGSRVFVTGGSGWTEDGDRNDYGTVAYDAENGTELWVTKYDGPVGDEDEARALVVSPDGSRVFVTGQSRGQGTGFDAATVAYDAANGSQIWLGRYNERQIGRTQGRWRSLRMAPACSSPVTANPPRMAIM